jgi:hypothetical protein
MTLLDAKGGKTRTLDLHNMAQRALFEYLSPAEAYDYDRDPESVYVLTSQRAAWLRQDEATAECYSGCRRWISHS